MKIVLYGLPCSGKTYLLDKVKTIKTICGSQKLNELSNNNFNNLKEKDKEKIRIKLCDELKNEDSFIMDGHYSFDKNVVFTDNDGALYDIFLYLYEKPEVIRNRIEKSDKNRKYLDSDIHNWQENEIKSLREYCHKNNKDFFVIDNPNYFNDFLDSIILGYNNVKYAKECVDLILEKCPNKEINLLDGDKTLVTSDISRKALNNFKTDIFDNNFYTGFQFWLYDKITESINVSKPDIEYNEVLLNLIKNEQNVIISSGQTDTWNYIGGINHILTFANKYISSDTKYFITKFLRKQKVITAYGDNINDLFMLQEANKGVIVICKEESKSLKDKDLKNLDILDLRKIHILGGDKELIDITKSSSKINDKRLRCAHLELGKQIGNYLSKNIKEPAQMLILERSGHFLGTGISATFDCELDLYKNNLPQINKNTVILVDGVINSGTQMRSLIEEIKKINKNIKVIVITNVIQNKSILKFNDCEIYAIRMSANSFKGERIKEQVNGKGPDTSDRLFGKIG